MPYCGSSHTPGIWVRGNTHTHTNISDGDSSPEEVVEWFKDHGYQFMVLTDHNKCAEAPEIDGIIVIRGEELSTEFGTPIHVNAIGIDSIIEPIKGINKIDTLQKNIDLALEAGGIPQVNHPNWYYSFDHHELIQLKRWNLLEIRNPSSGCNDFGDAAHPPVEQEWDKLLSLGMTVYAVGADDSHQYKQFGPEFDNPGRAWIYVRVSELTQSEILNNIRGGNFYASTGVELADLEFDGESLSLSIKPEEDINYRILFIGLHGQELREVNGTKAVYKLSGKPEETYVRAKIIASSGTVAWTQAIKSE